ncbi:uncharacterized protein LOC129984777 [Argiope bruennichi]|uniref:uncharacterized protein LOC129984777 n=1 Tax=Argiope bruennichi TaxID=94029 RepID=UPI0024949742|nr:uncharacterized protein LOC129984777 [Argiope bruennichi]XP_055950708.1 uncharacterized protein LOC129984777 [Argiope bruennichi]
MDYCKVLSLQHLSCSKTVQLLFNKHIPSIDVSNMAPPLIRFKLMIIRTIPHAEYRRLKKQLEMDIKKLNLSVALQKRMESYITPIFCEIEEWLNACFLIWAKKDDTMLVVMKSIPHCWSTDGTLDRAKSAKLIARNNNLLLINRFIFACIYCVYEEIQNLWEQLTPKDKAYFLEENSLHSYLNSIIKEWITYLESWLNKDWQFCVAWILGTKLWEMNVYVMKRVLLALTPIERSHYLLQALIDKEVDSDVMRFCLMIMTRDELELVCKASAVQVFKGLASWPLRTCFTEIIDKFWPYITVEEFTDLVSMLLHKIKDEKYDYPDLATILKKFWSKSPPRYRRIAGENLRDLSRALYFVLRFEYSFTKQAYLDCWSIPEE